jgi:uncharacterized membrane protein YqiK
MVVFPFRKRRQGISHCQLPTYQDFIDNFKRTISMKTNTSPKTSQKSNGKTSKTPPGTIINAKGEIVSRKWSEAGKKAYQTRLANIEKARAEAAALAAKKQEFPEDHCDDGQADSSSSHAGAEAFGRRL